MGAIRFSLGRDSTQADIDDVVDQLNRVLHHTIG